MTLVGGGEGLSAVQLTRWLKNVNIVDGKKVEYKYKYKFKYKQVEEGIIQIQTQIQIG